MMADTSVTAEVPMAEVVATSRTKNGGPCRHCRRELPAGTPITKLTRCCDSHPPRTAGVNGPGVWVCVDCRTLLMVNEIHDG